AEALATWAGTLCRGGPQIDVGIASETVDLGEFGFGEVEPAQRSNAVFHLLRAACADECGAHAAAAQDPRNRHLRQRLAATLRDLLELADVREILLVEEFRSQGFALGCAAAGRNSSKIP